MRDYTKLTDQALITGIQGKVGEERRIVAEFLLMLGEIDERRFYLVEGYEALYLYVTALGYTEAEAFSRITVARLVRKFVWLVDFYVRGRLGLTALKLLAPYLTVENAERLAGKASGLRIREVEQLVAGLRAKLPVAKSPTPLALVETPCKETEHQPQKPMKRDKTKFVTEETVEISFAAKAALATKIERAKALARPKGISSNLGDLVEHLVDEYLKRHDPLIKSLPANTRSSAKSSARANARAIARASTRERAKTTGICDRQPNTSSPPSKRSRYVPRSVAIAVKVRDGYRCSYVSRTGHRCAATAGLHLDHIVPHARGGSSTDPANLRYLCAAHNQLAAREVFGFHHIDRCIIATRCSRNSPIPPTRRATSEISKNDSPSM